ncbi:hypothetical protein DIPPA_13280 [Diplonema papillatum]|nr:hypothetical protein DIPPA_13280 [Diplonema papillatum]
MTLRFPTPDSAFPLVSWRVLLSVCLTSAVLVIATSLSLTRDFDGAAVASWADLPVPALLLPSVGLFLAPVYPALISVVLSALPKEKHASMTGLLTMFSALGGSTGSIITGFAFAAFDGRIAFHLAIPALLAILWLVQILRSLTRVPTDTGEPTTEADDPAAARVQLI